jgi:hypothetical protein
MKIDRNRRRMLARRLVLALALTTLVGSRPACDDEPPTLTCDRASIQLDPGECVEFLNPCDDHAWQRFDAFRLCDEPSGLFLQTKRNPQARSLCALTGTQLFNVEVDFFYARSSDTGVGAFVVSVGALMSATATANPPTVQPGESSQLDVTVAGGTPPYSYEWTPGVLLDDPAIGNPIASPVTATTFNVTVTDSEGLEAQASVVVNVGLGVEVSALPPVIDPGEISMLVAIAQGGTGPYTHEWSPPETLDLPTSPTPNATPENSTTYQVVVTDALGLTAIGSVDLAVHLIATPSATPAAIAPGESSQLDVEVLGGAPPYGFQWTSPDDLDDPFAQAPLTTPAATTTYAVTVTDALGAQVTGMVVVNVGAGPLAACFTVIPLASSPFLHEVQLDGSCSTGQIVEYRWWPQFNFEGQLPSEISASPLSRAFGYEGEAQVTIRLEVVDDTGATDIAEQLYDVVFP